MKDWMKTSTLRSKLLEMGFMSDIIYDKKDKEDSLTVFSVGEGIVAKVNLKGSGYIVNKDFEALDELLEEYNNTKRPAYERGEIS